MAPCSIPLLCCRVYRTANHEWIKAQGGTKAMEKRNLAKASLLYNEIDRNPLFKGTAAVEDRSVMNVCFVMNEGYEELEKSFMEFAQSKGMWASRVIVRGWLQGFHLQCHAARKCSGSGGYHERI